MVEDLFGDAGVSVGDGAVADDRRSSFRKVLGAVVNVERHYRHTVAVSLSPARLLRHVYTYIDFRFMAKLAEAS